MTIRPNSTNKFRNPKNMTWDAVKHEGADPSSWVSHDTILPHRDMILIKGSRGGIP